MWWCSSLPTPEPGLWDRFAPPVLCRREGLFSPLRKLVGDTQIFLVSIIYRAQICPVTDKICPVFASGWEIHGLNKSPRELGQGVVALQCICWEPGRAGRSLCFMARAEVGLSSGPKKLKFKRASALLPQNCDKYALWSILGIPVRQNN